MNRVSPTTDWTGLRLADLVVEAAFENLDAKHKVFARLESLCRPDAVLATNTSSLRVADIASVLADPSRVVGLHFFHPVPKMPLVEVVRTTQSSGEALATAATVAGRLGKTPVLVGDAPGFLVNRILIPYLSEALAMAGEGTSIAVIDRAMKRWGMPMGPFELLDEIGLDVAASVLKSLSSATGDPSLPSAVGAAIGKKWLGKKTGRGFYVHPAGGGKKSKKPEPPTVHVELASMLHAAAAAPAPANVDEAAEQEIQRRLVLPMVNQAAGALREGVVDSADAIDLATVMGTGLAPFRGGLTHFADVAGIPNVVGRLDALATKHGPRFNADLLLRDMAAAGGSFGKWMPPVAPTTVSPPANEAAPVAVS
jgi:3-hydroxyacyl-CoA dehydrogenase/enoyl-CoA hydratase/3-hydroxybutyryl-CoA epimerase